MARVPEIGRTKTRLIPVLGPEMATRIHTALVHATLATVRSFQQMNACHVDVWFSGGDESAMRQLFGNSFSLWPQPEGDLGERLQTAVQAAFSRGAGQVVVIGTDCPALEVRHLQAAFEQLTGCDIVLGPALDGGYYLLGQRRLYPELFQNIDWGTSVVLQQTLQRSHTIAASVRQLQTLSDVDFAEDLLICRHQAERYQHVLGMPQRGLLSIIIPTLNEAAVLESTLSTLRDAKAIEVIVADGGSTDQTIAIAEAAGARVLRCNQGRGRQMNAAAAVASGKVLLFLHADTRLPPDFETHVWQAVSGTDSGTDAQSIAAGAFQLQIEHASVVLRFISWVANLRSRWLQLPYGDQAIFVRAERFFQIQGFQHWPLLEDLDLCRRLRRVGRIRIVHAAAITSARRWQKLGVLRTTIINLICLLGYFLGASPDRLSQFYRRQKRSAVAPAEEDGPQP